MDTFITPRRLILLYASSYALKVGALVPAAWIPAPWIPGDDGGRFETDVTYSISWSLVVPSDSPVSMVTCDPQGPSGRSDQWIEIPIPLHERTNVAEAASDHDHYTNRVGHSFNVRGADEDCEEDMLCRITQEVLKTPNILELPQAHLKPRDEPDVDGAACCQFTPGCYELGRNLNAAAADTKVSRTDKHEWECCLRRFRDDCKAESKVPKCARPPPECVDTVNFCPPDPA